MTSSRIRLLPLPFDSVLTTRMRPTSPVDRTWVPPSACLSRPDDVDDADLRHRLRDHVDLGADEVLVLDGDRAGQERHLDGPVGGELGVDQLLDPRPEPLGQRVELEVHPGRQRLHVPAGDRHPPLVPDHAAEDVQRRVGAHEGVAAIPVDRAVHVVADRRQRVVAADGVPDVVALLAHVVDRQPGELAGVVGLAAAGRVEGGAIEGDPAALGVDVGTTSASKVTR